MKKSLILLGFVLCLSLHGCGQNPFELKLLTNNAFASVMVSFLKSLGAPVGMEKKLEGDELKNRFLEKVAGKSLAKLSSRTAEDIQWISAQAARDSLTLWLQGDTKLPSPNQLISDLDSIALVPLVNDTDNFESKTGIAIVNLGPQGFKNPESWKYWSFKGHTKKIQVGGRGDKVGEESEARGIVLIPTQDRRIFWTGKVTQAADGIASDSRDYNVGDSAVMRLDSIIKVAEDYVQYGLANYYDKSDDTILVDIALKVYHNNSIGLDDADWSDNWAETHFTLLDPTALESKVFYIKGLHYGENYPSASAPYPNREEGFVYKKRSCAGIGGNSSDPSSENCILKNGITYSNKYIVFRKPRGNAEGTVTFFDDDGNIIDER